MGPCNQVKHRVHFEAALAWLGVSMEPFFPRSDGVIDAALSSYLNHLFNRVAT